MATKAPRKNKKTSKMRRGMLSKEEKLLIQELILTKDDHEIARSLRRPVSQITNYKKLYVSNAPEITVRRTEAEEMRRELHCHSSWEAIQQQFSPEELLFYENSYVEYRKQFKDMTSTELKQLEHLITIEIFMQRHNIDRIDSQQEVERMNKLLKREYAKGEELTPAEMQNIQALEIQIQASRAAAVSRTKEFKDLLEKHQALLKDLKGTRDQRIKHLEDRGKFITILQELEIADRRKGVSEITGLMDLAVAEETKRLTKPFQYSDGMIDHPIINHEVLEDEVDPEQIYEEDLL